MQFNNISEAISAIDEISNSSGKPLYYRAQHHDWSITSSIHRINNDENRKEEILKASNFIEYLKTKDNLINKVEQYSKERMDLMYWAIAQHYGYKTDLIDFTTDIQIAKGFALIGKQTGENGFIMCLWKEDIEFISSIYKTYANQFPDDCQVLLQSVDYNPFFDFNLSEVSRIENQKGVFMWDVNALATKLFSGYIDVFFPGWLDMHTFSFKQTDISVDTKILRMIYPAANITEIEIDRYQQFYNRDFYYKNNIIPEIPPIKSDFSQYFRENIWNVSKDLFVYDSLIHYPLETQKIIVNFIDLKQINYLLSDLKNCEKFVSDWKEKLEENVYVMYICADNDSVKLFAEILNEVLSILSVYENFTSQIIGIIMYQSLRLISELFVKCRKNNECIFNKAMQELSIYEYNLNDSKSSIESILNLLRSATPIDEVVKDAWNHEFLFVKLRNISGNTSVCALPKDIINDCTVLYKKEHMQILNDLYDKSLIPPTVLTFNKNGNIERNRISKEQIQWELMLNIVRDPKVLFNEKDFLQFLIYFIIPWQLIMAPKRNRIYNSFEIKSIERLDADNFETGHLYYWEGSYYTIQ